MESHNGTIQAFKEKPAADPSKDFVMEQLTNIDPGDVFDDQEKSGSLMHHSFFHNTFSRGTLKDVKNRMKEQAKNVTASKVITSGIIFFIIGVFSIPVIFYYTLRTDPIPHLDSVLSDVNISTVNIVNMFLCHVEFLHVATYIRSYVRIQFLFNMN